MNKDLEKLLLFTEFTNLFATIKRNTILNKDGSAENNSQHSFQLAIVAWYISEYEKLDLDQTKLIKYALVHDLMETYSGTFPTYDRNSNVQAQKDLSEEKSIKKILKEFNYFGDLTLVFKKYLKLEDNESKFIYSLDKLLPIVNIELNNHDYYFETKTTYKDMINIKEKKISKDKTIYKYFLLLKKYLKDEANFFWPDNKKRDYSDKNYRFT